MILHVYPLKVCVSFWVANVACRVLYSGQQQSNSNVDWFDQWWHSWEYYLARLALCYWRTRKYVQLLNSFFPFFWELKPLFAQLKDLILQYVADIYFQVKNDEDILQTLTSENNFVVWNAFSHGSTLHACSQRNKHNHAHVKLVFNL